MKLPAITLEDIPGVSSSLVPTYGTARVCRWEQTRFVPSTRVAKVCNLSLAPIPRDTVVFLDDLSNGDYLVVLGDIG